jgi:hypothetical protein
MGERGETVSWPANKSVNFGSTHKINAMKRGSEKQQKSAASSKFTFL